MRLRTISRFSVIVLVVVVGVVIVVHSRLDGSHQSLVGTNLGATVAPGFSLTDQSGATVTLADQRGRPVALTFLTSNCADECAQTAAKLRSAIASLGPNAGSVSWLAVSLDPAADTAQSSAAFVAQYQVAGALRFLAGTPSQLEPIWKAYGVAGQVGSGTPSGRALAAGFGVFVIDSQGRERVYLDSAFEPAALASDLKALLA